MPSSAAQIDTEAPMIADLEVAAVSSLGIAEEDPSFPGSGLPDPLSIHPEGNIRSWQGSQTRGLNYAAPLAQWVSVPSLQMVIFNQRPRNLAIDPTCSHPYNAYRGAEWNAHAALVNVEAPLDGARRYGESQPFEVQAVAFGSVPVVATVALEQPRNGSGILELVRVQYLAGQWGGVTTAPDGHCHQHAPFQTRPTGTGLGSVGTNSVFHRPLPDEDSPVAWGEVRLRVDALRIDGVDLALAGSCRSAFAHLELEVNNYVGWDPSLRPEQQPNVDPPNRDDPVTDSNLLTTPFFSLSNGGLLFGELEIGTFSGCATRAGDDLSALLNATVSGPGQRVEVRNSGVGRIAAPGAGVCPVDFNCHEYFPAPEIPDSPPEGRP